MPWFRATTRTLTAWLLAVCVFAWLHPALAALAVLAQGPQSTLVEVCTHQGVRWVSLASADFTATDTPSDSDDNPATSHCPLCRVLADLPLNLERDDLRFAPPAWLRQPPPRQPPPHPWLGVDGAQLPRTRAALNVFLCLNPHWQERLAPPCTGLDAPGRPWPGRRFVAKKYVHHDFFCSLLPAYTLARCHRRHRLAPPAAGSLWRWFWQQHTTHARTHWATENRH